MATHLRLFYQPDVAPSESKPNMVPVRLGEILPLLTMAQRFKYTWLRDFLDDEVHISNDLYQVLEEFLGYRPTA
jgi:hypothetical protein